MYMIRNNHTVLRRIITIMMLCMSCCYVYGGDNYNISEAKRYNREANYYQRQAESYLSDAEYYMRQAESAKKNMEYYAKRGDEYHSKSYKRYMEDYLSKYNSKLRSASDAYDKAADYLDRASRILRR